MVKRVSSKSESKEASMYHRGFDLTRSSSLPSVQALKRWLRTEKVQKASEFAVLQGKWVQKTTPARGCILELRAKSQRELIRITNSCVGTAADFVSIISKSPDFFLVSPARLFRSRFSVQVWNIKLEVALKEKPQILTSVHFFQDLWNLYTPWTCTSVSSLSSSYKSWKSLQYYSNSCAAKNPTSVVSHGPWVSCPLQQTCISSNALSQGQREISLVRGLANARIPGHIQIIEASDKVTPKIT